MRDYRYHLYGHEVRQDAWLKSAQWAAWVVGLAVMVWAYTHGPLSIFVSKRPVMTMEQSRQVSQMMYDIGHRGETNRAYDGRDYGRDQRALLNLRNIVDGCLMPGDQHFSERWSQVAELLYTKAVATETGRIMADTHDAQAAKISAENIVGGYARANVDAYRTGKVVPVSGLPVPVSNPFPWSAFWHAFGLAWALSLIPASCAVVLRFRGRLNELGAELADRPWAPVLSTVFWWYGAYGYNGADLIGRDFSRRCWDYQHEHGVEPSPDMQRMLWERAAATYVGGYERAVELAAKYPQLVAMQSRRAAFIGLLATTIGTPLQLLANVVTAYAETARVTPAIALVDTTGNRRTVSGRTFGIMTWDADNSFRLGTLWGIGKMRQGRVTVESWTNVLQPSVMMASATYALSDHVGLEGGRIWTPVGNALPGPDTGLFPISGTSPLFPIGASDGVAVHASAPHLTAIASSQRGMTPGSTDEDVYLSTSLGTLNVQGGGHTGSERFGFGMVDISHRGVLLRETVVTRPDRNAAVAATDLVYRHNNYRGGVHLEHDRWQVSAERKLGASSRLVVHLGHINGVAGHQLILKAQHGFALAP